MSNQVIIDQDSVLSDIEGYSSGYPYLDYLTGIPGVLFPKGAVSEVMGLKSTSKSTLILETVAHYYRTGGTGKTLYVDFEKTVLKQLKYLNVLGVPTSNPDFFEYIQPNTMQEGGDHILKTLRAKPVKSRKSLGQLDYAFIIVDTVAAMRPAQEVENPFAETHQKGLKALLMSELLRNITADLMSDGPAVIFVNQIYEELSINKKAFMGKTYDSSSSNALKYYASFRLTLTLKSKIKGTSYNPLLFAKEETFVGSVIEAMTEKSKIGVPFRKVPYVVRYGYGIDPIPTMINAAINKKVNEDGYMIIEVTGNNANYSFNLGDNTMSQAFKGVGAFSSHLTEDKASALAIANQLSPEWYDCINILDKGSYGEYDDIQEVAESDGTEDTQSL